jgi:phage head maturation protease
MAKILGPRGWSADQVTTRFLSSAPLSFNRETRSVNAVISRGSPVTRFYGVERLRVDKKSVILDRMQSGGVPLLDSHNNTGISSALGRVRSAWFDGGALMGSLTFNQTPQGEMAMGMVERSEILALSAGYRVEAWEITDEDGNPVDENRASFEDDLTFTATRWELLEASLVTVPADSLASIRSIGSGANHILNARERIQLRQRVYDNQQMYERRFATMDRNLRSLERLERQNAEKFR